MTTRKALGRVLSIGCSAAIATLWVGTSPALADDHPAQPFFKTATPGTQTDHPNARYAAIEPDAVMFDRAGTDLASVRLYPEEDSTQASSVPYFQRDTDLQLTAIPAKRLNYGVSGDASTAVFSVGPNIRHSATTITLRTNAKPTEDWLETATLEGSNDQTTWVKFAEGTVFKIAGSPNTDEQTGETIYYSPTNFSYIRATVPNSQEILAVSVEPTVNAADGDLASLPVQRQVRSAVKKQTATSTTFTLDLGHRNVPVDAIAFESSTSSFDREVAIYASKSRDELGPKHSAPITTDHVFRYNKGERLVVPTSTDTRYLLVSIENGDDAPLNKLTISPRAVSRALLFEADQPKYRVEYGAKLASPDFDIQDVAKDDSDILFVSMWQLSPQKRNTKYAEERAQEQKNLPLFDRYTWLDDLLVVAGALVVAAGAAWMLLRKKPE